MAILSAFRGVIILNVNKLNSQSKDIELEISVSSSICKKFGNCHYVLTTNKNLNSSWIHKRKEDTGQTTACKIGETNRYRESWFTRAETHKQKLPWEPVLRWET